MYIDDVYTCCENIAHDAEFRIYGTVGAYTRRQFPVWVGAWVDMPRDVGSGYVHKFTVDDDGETVHVWAVPTVARHWGEVV